MRIATTLSILLGVATAASGQPRPTVADLAWISGCWLIPGSDPASFVTERWTRPYGIMIGTNRTVEDGSVTAYEFLRIEERQGKVYYVAKHSAEPEETAFKLKVLEERRVVFENPDREFPTRIIYSVSPDTLLTVRVEDDERGFGQTFEKARCGGM